MPSALCELTSMIKPFYSSSLHPIFAPLDRKALFGVRADNNSCHSVRAPYMQSCVERAKSPFSKWLKTSDPGAKLCGELLSFPLSRKPVIHARSVCFCAAACGKQDRGVERRPLFEAHLQVNDIWASSLIQLSMLEMQAQNSGPTGDGAAAGKMRQVVSNHKGPLAFLSITLMCWNVWAGDAIVWSNVFV